MAGVSAEAEKTDLLGLSPQNDPGKERQNGATHDRIYIENHTDLMCIYPLPHRCLRSGSCCPA